MATNTGVFRFLPVHSDAKQSVSGLRFDWLMVGLSFWFLGGLFIDGWAHAHGKVDSTFFTPWHAVFYSGFVAVAAGLCGGIVLNRRRGQSWQQAIPVGYALSLLGVGIFAVGGVGDMTWHILFGIEQSTEALLSPTHLLLALGLTLILSGPFRATWLRSEKMAVPGWIKLLPMLISLTFTLSILTFFTEYANPITHTFASLTSSIRWQQDMFVSMSVDSYLIYTAILMGVVLLALRRWYLPFGAIAVIFALNAALMSLLGNVSNIVYFVPVLFLAGLCADFLLRRLQPSEERIGAVRLFSFTVPLVLYLLYFLALMIVLSQQGSRFTWSIHLWMGSAVIAGVVGLLISFLVFPPARPASQSEL